jgi:hypothetical protein
MMRMKKSIVGGLAVLAVVVAACQPTKPPPPPPQPPNVDVLLLGDSVGFGVGCMLGDNGPDDGQSCPPKPGFSTANGYLGACAVGEGQILLYNATAVQGNCNEPASDASSLWPQAVNAVDPELVVIVTGGWEIVHRWTNLPLNCDPASVFLCARPDRQMGSTAEGGALNTNAVNNYMSEMTAVITAIRNTPSQPKVLLLNSPYVAPPAPSGSPGVWYEAYPDVKPGNWTSPNLATPYISSKDKIDQFNAAIETVIGQINSNDVQFFDFWAEFSPDGEYSDDLCVFPDNKLPLDQCPGATFTARLEDAGHLTTAGNNLLGEYLLPEVYAMLGIPEP